VLRCGEGLLSGELDLSVVLPFFFLSLSVSRSAMKMNTSVESISAGVAASLLMNTAMCFACWIVTAENLL
jgi:hypothetical protein